MDQAQKQQRPEKEGSYGSTRESVAVLTTTLERRVLLTENDGERTREVAVDVQDREQNNSQERAYGCSNGTQTHMDVHNSLSHFLMPTDTRPQEFTVLKVNVTTEHRSCVLWSFLRTR